MPVGTQNVADGAPGPGARGPRELRPLASGLPRLGTSGWRVDPSPVSLGPGVGRFRDPTFSGGPLPPFPGYVRQPRPRGLLGGDVRTRPRFAVVGHRATAEVAIEPGTLLYGTGEQAGNLVRNGTRKVCWNTDIPDYSDESRSLYQSHPWVLAVREDGTAFGVICETTWRCTIDLTRGIRFEVEGPSPAVTIIERDSARGVLEALAGLTGTMELPPLWALGYHQCRYSYFPEARVREVAGEFRARKIPCDVIWMDIDYMEGFRCFTFSKERFPNPRKLNVDLHKKGFRTIYMIDPGIKVDPSYSVYAGGRKGGHFVRDARGGEYHGDVWPGPCAFPDYTRSNTRRWWGGLYKAFIATGIDGVWNDMNEPAVFGGVGPGKTMPGDNQHQADRDLGGPDAHDRYHNIYGMQMARGTVEGILGARPRVRPFVLTRANFLGGQRYAATWTGDNRSDWRHLAWSIPMALNLGLSGQPFAGPDIGGFLGDADAKLFARWMGVGALLPFSRGHSDTASGPHEPWAFGKACEATCRRAIERRYRLLPYLYTLFREASRTGMPVARPVWMADPTDPRLRGVQDAFLLGDDVLVCAADAPDGARSGVLPRGAWREFDPRTAGGKRERADEDLPRLYLREGAAIAVGEAAQHTDPKSLLRLTVVASPDASGRARGVQYVDAGEGFAYRKGAFGLYRLEVDAAGARAKLTCRREEGKLRAKLKTRLVVLG